LRGLNHRGKKSGGLILIPKLSANSILIGGQNHSPLGRT